MVTKTIWLERLFIFYFCGCGQFYEFDKRFKSITQRKGKSDETLSSIIEMYVNGFELN